MEKCTAKNAPEEKPDAIGCAYLAVVLEVARNSEPQPTIDFILLARPIRVQSGGFQKFHAFVHPFNRKQTAGLITGSFTSTESSTANHGDQQLAKYRKVTANHKAIY